MDQLRDTVEEATESVNPKEQGPLASDPSKSVRSDHDMNLKQRSLSVVEYEKEFSHLSKYAPKVVLTEAFRCR